MILLLKKGLPWPDYYNGTGYPDEGEFCAISLAEGVKETKEKRELGKSVASLSGAMFQTPDRLLGAGRTSFKQNIMSNFLVSPSLS